MSCLSYVKLKSTFENDLLRLRVILAIRISVDPLNLAASDSVIGELERNLNCDKRALTQ
jgi:hypothetical protein